MKIKFKIFILLCRTPVTLNFFRITYEGDPLSPPEGEADQGENPLDPLIISPVSGEFKFLEAHPSRCLRGGRSSTHSKDLKKFS